MSGSHKKSTPAPLETDPGEQLDDNIDDLGHRPDGSVQKQPTDADKRRDANGKPSEKSDKT